MTVAFTKSSPQAEEAAKSFKQKDDSKYPFNQLEVGMSFTIAKSEANLNSLKTYSSQKSKDGKRYVVVDHDGLGIFEVARIS